MNHKRLCMLLAYVCIIWYFTGCSKKEEVSGSSTLSLYCADKHEDFNENCTHACNGEWVRLIMDAEFRFKTEEECLK